MARHSRQRGYLVDREGEPVARPVQMAGDKAFRADWIDEYLLGLDIQRVIPSKSNEDQNNRAVAFDRDLVGWLKENRRIFSRFEKTAKNFAGMIKLAFIRRYLRLMCN
jgi:hypothetical protein